MAAHGPHSVHGTINYVLFAFNIIFYLSILKGFVTSFTPDGELEPITSLRLIRLRYFHHGTLISDIVCQFPFYNIFETLTFEAKLLYLIKIYRIKKGMQVFKVTALMDSVRDFMI